MIILVASTIIFTAALACLAVCAHKGGVTILFYIDTVPLSETQKQDREIAVDTCIIWALLSIFSLAVASMEFDVKVVGQILFYSTITCYMIVRNYYSDSGELIGVTFPKEPEGAYAD